jgi:VIT1/CCC1 family predicted Fe2+/Mn2+ transporter
MPCSELVGVYPESHRTQRTGWLRAAVLGANDGTISTASLVVGVAAAHATYYDILVAGVAGLAAGAMSMAAGEYVSVSSQSDTERADLKRERRELDTEPEHERDELAEIYVSRGLTPEIAKEVAHQLMAHDALGAHARDELGISDTLAARPIQAAFASAGAFVVGAIFPLLAAAASPIASVVPVVVGSTLVVLAALGAFAAIVGGAPAKLGAARVVLWGAIAMGITAAVGALFRVSM